jgi:hypothetical protein
MPLSRLAGSVPPRLRGTRGSPPAPCSSLNPGRQPPVDPQQAQFPPYSKLMAIFP